MTEFLSPVSERLLSYRETLPAATLGTQMHIHSKTEGLPELEGAKFAMVAIHENRNDVDYAGGDICFDRYREAFYSLYPGNWKYRIVDLGDIKKGETPEDSYFALKEVVAELLRKEVIPLVLGAGQDMVYAQYRAYDALDKMVNIVNIDNRFDLGNTDLPITSKSYVGKIVVDEPYNLFNYTVLGYQSFFNAPEEIALMDKMFFEAYRLGEITADIALAEPVMRDADIVALDVSAIKNSELGYKYSGSPNGFDGREICKLSRYAGISDRVTSFGVYQLDAEMEQNNGAMLVAQIVWYFIEGVNFRIKEGDLNNETHFTTYIVPVDDNELIFKKSHRSERWWVELPNFSNVNNKLKSGALLPCTYADYLGACNQEIPERWLKARRKNEV